MECSAPSQGWVTGGAEEEDSGAQRGLGVGEGREMAFGLGWWLRGEWVGRCLGCSVYD